MRNIVTAVAAVRARTAPALVGLPLVLFVAACNADRLLDVETPDQISVGDANTAAGAQALRAAAIGNFANFYGGTLLVGSNVYAGLLSDELINARPGGEHLDQRAFNPNQFPNLAWNNFGQAHTQIVRARRGLLANVPESPTRAAQVANLHALEGFSLLIAGELFCNGVPLSTVNDESPAWDIVSNADMFERAVVQFDSAVAVAAGEPTQTNLARIGKARALVDLGRYADAATEAATVPTSFLFATEYSATTLVNGVFDWMVNTANFGPADREGGNGLDYRSAGDPRVVVSTTFRLGQDGSTQVFTIQGYPNGSAPQRLAAGVEARLIEAEAALAAGDATAYLTALNAARADAGARAGWGIVAAGADPLPPITDPGTPAAQLDLLFRERAFWFYLTAHRTGDLRRLVRQYGRSPETVWPTGAYFKGGTYGTDQNITPSFAEQNNPSWQGCTDRDP